MYIRIYLFVYVCIYTHAHRCNFTELIVILFYMVKYTAGCDWIWHKRNLCTQNRFINTQKKHMNTQTKSNNAQMTQQAHQMVDTAACASTR